jgi:hypothetical protein
MQKVVVGHETDSRCTGVPGVGVKSTTAGVDQLPPEKTEAAPSDVPATQKDVVGQEIACAVPAEKTGIGVPHDVPS